MTTRLLKSSENINGLPIGFQEVEYLESTGTQYIDTGVPLTQNDTCEVVYSPISYGNFTGVFGSRSSANSKNFASGDNESSPYITADFNNSDYTTYRASTPDLPQTGSIIKVIVNKNQRLIYVNGVLTASNTTICNDTFTTPSNCLLFGTYGVNSVKPHIIRVYRFKIYDKRDFIPALNPAGRPCMYDLVGKKAYYNLGTDEFTYGREIHYVDYLESTSNQASLNYITTTYTPTTNTSLEAKVRYTGGASGATWAIGAATWWGIHYQGSGPKIGITNSSTDQYQVYTSYTAGNDITLKLDGSNVYADGTLVGSLTKQNASSTLTLFRYSTSANLSWVGRIYYLDIWDNNGDVFKFRPAIDENGVCFMFDKVTHTCYLNAGTGTFSYGKKLYSSKVRLYKDSEANKLPAGFKIVEYLESNGGQYIDTGIQPTDEYGYRIRNTYTAGQGEQCAIGCMDSGNRFVGVYTSGSANAISGAWGSFVGFLPSYTWTTGTILDVKCNYKDSRKIVIDTTEMKDISDVHISGTISSTLYIGARHYGSTITTMKGKIYGVEITKGTEVINKFIPALDTTSTPCMYDTVTQTAFYNQGSGQFTYGAVIPNKVRLPQSTEIRFPKGYTEVEYLASDGNQYIDTEVLGNGEFDVDYMYCQTQDQSNAIFAGTRAASQHLNFGQRSNGSTGAFSMAYLGEYWQAISSPAINTNVRVQISYKNGSQTGTLNGTTMISKSLTGTEATNLSIYLFKRHHYGTDNVTGLVGRIYYFKLWNNGTLVRNFIPCLDPNGRPCLWDTVTKKPYYNQGTGEFTYGRSIQQVEYLESSGTQYIDTLWSPLSNNLRVKFKAKSMGSPLGTAICGAEKNGITPRWVFILYGQSGNSTKTYPLTGDWNNTSSDTAFTFTSGTTLEIDWVTNSTETTIADKVTNTSFTQTFASTMNYPNNVVTLKLFQNSDTQKSSIQMNYYQIWDNNTLVRDYVPAIDSNNVGFMFDRVTHTIFDNAGTGSFTYGSPVPNKIRN